MVMGSSRRTTITTRRANTRGQQRVTDERESLALVAGTAGGGSVGLFDRSRARQPVRQRAWFFALASCWPSSSLDTWQLVINTATTIVTFLLVALLQNSQWRGAEASSRKLNAIADGLADTMESLAELMSDAVAERAPRSDARAGGRPPADGRPGAPHLHGKGRRRGPRHGREESVRCNKADETSTRTRAPRRLTRPRVTNAREGTRRRRPRRPGALPPRRGRDAVRRTGRPARARSRDRARARRGRRPA